MPKSKKMLRTALAGLILLGGATHSRAADQCAIGDDIPAAPILKDSKVDAKVFDLQLVYSWSPYHCKQTGADTKQSKKDKAKKGALAAWDTDFQCKRNNFGFVVHGLWPQAEGKTGKQGQPRACKPAAPLAPQVVRQHLCTVPGVYLMQNEWQAHGTCHWNAPEAYFGDIDKLTGDYPMPDLAALQNRDVKVDDVVAAIVDGSNGTLSAEMVGVRAAEAAKKRSLQEIYICMDLQYKPKVCPSRGTPGDLNVFVWPVPKPNTP